MSPSSATRHLAAWLVWLAACGPGPGKPVEGDSIYNGADDDASGVATVLAAAGALAKAPPRRTVIVLLTSGEEFGPDSERTLYLTVALPWQGAA